MPRGRQFTDGEEQQIVKIYEAGHSIAAIIRAYGLSPRCRAVEKALRKYGVEILAGKRKISLSKEAEIVKEYQAGTSAYKLADKYGIWPGAMCSLLKRNGCDRRDNRVLTDDQEQQVIREYLSGKSVFAVGDMFGIHGTTIPLILARHGYETRAVGHNSRQYHLDESVFDSIDNEAAAYWLGFIYADGCVQDDGLKVALSIKDISQLKRLRAFFSSDIRIKIYKARTPQKKIKQYCRLEIYSFYVVNRLRQCGIIPGRWCFHLTLEQLHPSVYRHFIRGLVDGDGTVDTTKKANARIRMLGQEDILDWIRKTLADVAGTNPEQKLYHKIGIDSLEYGGGKQARAIITWLYEGTSLYLDRKFAKTQGWWGK